MLPKLSNRIQTLPLEYMVKEEFTDEGGLYAKDRVISPIQPTVVRQDSPEGPTYQEALGYTFLVNLIGLPGLCHMDDGRLVLSAFALLEGCPASIIRCDPSIRQPIILYSDDDGRSWSQPRRMPLHRAKLVNLGGSKLMAHSLTAEEGAGFWFSEDEGVTWSGPEVVPPLPDGRWLATDLSYSPLVEGDTIWFLFFAPEEPGYSRWDSGELFTRAVLRRYHVDSHTWEEPFLFPKEWWLCEGSITRAGNGDLVAVFRTQMDGVPILSDHWMGMASTRSADNGKTWAEPARHLNYGHLHMNLLPLPDGRILMTYAARIGEIEGMPYHGIEAVLSHDNGATWDWEHRYILFRWLPDQCMHSPQSVLLSDGRILTIFMHLTRFTWTDGEEDAGRNGINITSVHHISAVIWRI